MKKITIKDVAREAGVSFSTVSKVVNNDPSISEKTKAHVRGVMKRMNYVPNQRAASFARGATKQVAYVTCMQREEAFNNPHMFEILCGAQRKMASKGYSVLLVDASGEEQPGDIAIRLLEQQQVDGVMVHGAAINRRLASLLASRGLPHVVIGRPDFATEACWIDTNNQVSGSMATRHLLEGGAKRIAFIGGREVDQISLNRQLGYVSVMHEAGLPIPAHYVQYTDSSIEQSYAVATQLLQGPERPEGLICENNMIAIGALKAVRELSLAMPRDISFITFDNYPYSRVMEPQPTVVDIDVYEMGEDAASMLLRKMKNPQLQVQSYTTLPKLTVRGTTHAARG